LAAKRRKKHKIQEEIYKECRKAGKKPMPKSTERKQEKQQAETSDLMPIFPAFLHSL